MGCEVVSVLEKIGVNVIGCCVCCESGLVLC